MRALLATAALAVTFLISPAHRVQAAEGASFDDTAKFLAGMQPSADSPLTPLTHANNWKAHARHFDEQWKSVDARQLSRVRAWVSGNLSDTSGTLFYMFSGPDILYATTFFPNASTYVLSGLEQTGPIPNLSNVNRLRALGGPRPRQDVAAAGIEPRVLHHLADGRPLVARPAPRHHSGHVPVSRAHRQDHQGRELRAAGAERHRQGARRIDAAWQCPRRQDNLHLRLW